MKIYVDMDDVLCETARHLCRLAERFFQRTVAYEQVFQFDLQEVFGLTDEEMKRFMALSHRRDSLLAHAATRGARKSLLDLRAAGHDVHIVTGRPGSAHAATAEWLAKRGLGGFPVTFVDKYGRDAHYPHNPDDPPTVTLPELLAQKFDLVIDDSPSILRHLTAWPKTRIFVFARPWNVHYALAPNMTRVNGWPEIRRQLNV